MKKILLLSVIIICSLSLFSQSIIRDSVSMGKGYSNDIYYGLKNNSEIASVSNTNYHLAFSNMISQDDKFYTIWINDNNTDVFVNPEQGIGDWADFNYTNYKSWRKLQNSDSSWGKGGFSTGVEKHPRYTWAVYVNNGEFMGDSLYFIGIKDGLGNYTKQYKLRIIQRKSASGKRTWAFKYGTLNNSWDTTISLSDETLSSGNFMYFDMQSHNEVVHEPKTADWDIVFTRYSDYQEAEMFYYPVTGVLNNYKVKAKKISRKMIQDVTFMDWADTQWYSKKINSIGYDWKYLDASNKLFVADSTVYMVAKTLDDGKIEVYAIQFIRFEGSATGKIVFNTKRLGFITHTQIVNQVLPAQVFPNPASSFLKINIEIESDVVITNLLGDKIAQFSLNEGNNTLDLSRFKNGLYIANLKSKNGESSHFKFQKN